MSPASSCTRTWSLMLVLAAITVLASRYPNRKVTKGNDLDFVSYLRLYNYMTQPIDIQGIDIIDKKKLNYAVSNFQTMAGVEASGTMNNLTYRMMHLPRCGSLDMRSPSQFLSNRRFKRFYTTGKRLKGRVIYWRLANRYPGMSYGDTRRILTEAFRLWARAGQLVISETSDPRANIRITFAYLDGPGMRLGDTYVPLPKAEITFDSAEKWSAKRRAEKGEFNFFQYATHQIGHVMGLQHSTEEKSVMHPIYKEKPAFTLGYDDILAMHELYIK